MDSENSPGAPVEISGCGRNPPLAPLRVGVANWVGLTLRFVGLGVATGLVFAAIWWFLDGEVGRYAILGVAINFAVGWWLVVYPHTTRTVVLAGVFCLFFSLAYLCAGIWLLIGRPYYQQQVAIQEIEGAGGNFSTEQGGPYFLREAIGDEWMEYFDTVVQVDLLDTRFSDDAMESLGKLNHLRALRLSGTYVTDSGLSHLSRLSNLKSLVLYNTRVSDAGMKYLGGLTNLEGLWLSNTQVSDVGVRQLAGLNRLKWLDVGRTRVTKAGVRFLEQKLPSCNVQ